MKACFSKVPATQSQGQTDFLPIRSGKGFFKQPAHYHILKLFNCLLNHLLNWLQFLNTDIFKEQHLGANVKNLLHPAFCFIKLVENGNTKVLITLKFRTLKHRCSNVIQLRQAGITGCPESLNVTSQGLIHIQLQRKTTNIVKTGMKCLASDTENFSSPNEHLPHYTRLYCLVYAHLNW